MKKKICLTLSLLLLLASLSACFAKTDKMAFTADNEILTYQKIDKTKTQIIVSRTGNISVEDFCREFEELNPDIQIIYIDITGGEEGCKPLVEWIKNGYTPDIVITAANFFEDDLAEKYFENLSDSPIIENYEASALKRTSNNGNIYWLPGPNSINAMMYNKTLFSKYGWSVPKTFDEFVSLCDLITLETNGTIEAWNPNAKYDMELLTAIEGFVYEQLLAGIENRTWYDDFINGQASFSEHMQPYFTVIQTLTEHNILREEHFSYSATTRGKEFAAGKIAMINGNIYAVESDEYEFGYIPFPTTEGENGFISNSYSCYIGVPIKEHTKAQNEAVERFLAFFSSPEGQAAYIGNSLKISNVKNVTFAKSNELIDLKPTVDAGNMFTYLDFKFTDENKEKLSLYGYVTAVTNRSKTVAQCLDDAEAVTSKEPEVKTSEPAVALGHVESDMTILQTSFFIADAYRKTMDSDIALIADNVPYRGNVMKLFVGDITKNTVNVLKPRSLANNSALIKVTMTGKQLLAALNDPLGNERTEDCIYAYSGLICEIAPFAELGNKYISVCLSDGSAVDEDTLYTVAVWEGTVKSEYISGVVASYDGSWEEMMSGIITAEKTIAPADDKRVKLIWK